MVPPLAICLKMVSARLCIRLGVVVSRCKRSKAGVVGMSNSYLMWVVVWHSHSICWRVGGEWWQRWQT